MIIRDIRIGYIPLVLWANGVISLLKSPYENCQSSHSLEGRRDGLLLFSQTILHWNSTFLRQPLAERR